MPKANLTRMLSDKNNSTIGRERSLGDEPATDVDLASSLSTKAQKRLFFGSEPYLIGRGFSKGDLDSWTIAFINNRMPEGFESIEQFEKHFWKIYNKKGAS